MVKCRDLNKIEYIKHIKKSKKYKITKGINALDTETEKGKAFIIGNYNNEGFNYLVSNNVDNQLKYLSNWIFYRNNNFFYNLGYDFQAIIKGLPEKNINDLRKWNKTIYNNYEITYLNGKMFSIKDITKNKTSMFYDLLQFFNYNSLNNSAQKFLGMQKENLKDEGIDIKNLKYSEFIKNNKYAETLKKYLKRDCEITYKLAIKLNDLVKPYLTPKRYHSQASFSEQYYLENLKNDIILPNKEIIQYALNSYQGGRFEVFQKGFFNDAYISDIKSAYPYHNIKIPDISKGKWVKSKVYEDKALLSIYKINIKIPEMFISPLKYQIHNGSILYPIGKFKEIYINKTEYNTLIDIGLNPKIIDGYHFFSNNPEYPYLFLKDFYDLKEKYKRENKKELSWIPKIIINGFYGKTIQLIERFEYSKEDKGKEDLYDLLLVENKFIYVYKKWKAGRLFNPIVANEITANTRCQLFNSVKNDMDNIIGFQTDSIIHTKPLKLNYGDKLGDWELENKGSMIILGSGIYQMLGDKPKMKLRGFSKDLDLFNLLSQNKNKDNIEITLKRNIKLKSIFREKGTFKEKENKFNQILDINRQININFDKKRIWNRDFFNCDDVLKNQIKSNPIKI